MEEFSSVLTEIGNLARTHGVLAAVVLVLTAGVAIRGPAYVKELRLGLKDYWDHKRKLKQIDAMIKRETDRIAGKIESRKTARSASTKAKKPSPSTKQGGAP